MNELKSSLESALEREGKLKSNVTNSNNNVAMLQEKLTGATAACARVGALESSLSEKEAALERLSTEVVSVKSQLSKAEVSRDAQ
jgi:chromosome segregation ATPase